MAYFVASTLNRKPMKKIFVIDWILIPMFIFSAYTGISLHVAGHGNDHETWHNWAVFHVLTSFIFLIAALFHVTAHWNWYRGIIKNGIGKKSKITVGLSAVFVLVIITGIILPGVDGANSDIGKWHYRTGITASILSAVHILKRIPILRQTLKK